MREGFPSVDFAARADQEQIFEVMWQQQSPNAWTARVYNPVTGAMRKACSVAELSALLLIEPDEVEALLSPDHR